MKTILARILLLSVVAHLAFVPSALAQRQLGKKKGPTSKLYLAEATGEGSITNSDKIYTARQATAFDAPGTVIETKEGGQNSFVYSNGTGMFVDQNTRVEIDSFVQEPFQPQRNETAEEARYEPSISQSAVRVAHGAVGVCTSNLVSGSSMAYSTPQGSVNIRGGKVSIATNADETVIDLLDGDITVRGGGRDIGGQILRPGERAVIKASPAGLPPTITISAIPAEELQAADDRVSIACNAKKKVTFEIIEKKAAEGLEGPGEPVTAPDGTLLPSTGSDATEQEIVVKPTVPATTNPNVVVSPDRLPGTT
jgi:hypothetical protein